MPPGGPLISINSFSTNLTPTRSVFTTGFSTRNYGLHEAAIIIASMSGLPPKAAIQPTDRHVRYGPKADHLPFIQLVASFTRELVGKTNWNSDPILPSDDAVS